MTQKCVCVCVGGWVGGGGGMLHQGIVQLNEKKSSGFCFGLDHDSTGIV